MEPHLHVRITRKIVSQSTDDGARLLKGLWAFHIWSAKKVECRVFFLFILIWTENHYFNGSEIESESICFKFHSLWDIGGSHKKCTWILNRHSKEVPLRNKIVYTKGNHDFKLLFLSLLVKLGNASLYIQVYTRLHLYKQIHPSSTPCLSHSVPFFFPELILVL